MNPIKFCVKFKPPRLCLIYELNNEELFHEFLISSDDLEMPTKQLVNVLKKTHQGYLDEIDSRQIEGLIERIKTESKKKVEKQAPSNNKKLEPMKNNPGSNNAAPAKPVGKLSSVDKFRTMLGNLGISESDSSSEEQVDFNAVEKSFQNEDDSDY